MNEALTPDAKPRSILSARRIVLLATTIAGLGAAAFVVAPAFTPNQSLSSSAYAQNLTKETESLPKPVGFADIVAKVKPAVISVRVKVERDRDMMSFRDEFSIPRGMPFERFFRRRFGRPDGTSPHGPRRRHFSTGQGSGFFISAVSSPCSTANATSAESTRLRTLRVIGK